MLQCNNKPQDLNTLSHFRYNILYDGLKVFKIKALTLEGKLVWETLILWVKSEKSNCAGKVLLQGNFLSECSNFSARFYYCKV